ncbi:MAG: hypothetical protein J6W64_03530 [Bacilli bacterium]|nr:hypothetical protein [Bacilli bacterium]
MLPEVIGTSNTVNNSYGGNLNLNITMNVDEIGSDYDVDRIVDRVKEVIYDTSSYRNINVLNFTR